MRPLATDDLTHILDHTAHLWRNEFKGARIFITGGTGFFGKWLVASLEAARERLGVDVRATLLHRALHGDIRSFTFPQGEHSHIVHAAAPSVAPGMPPLELFDIIVGGAKRVVEFAGRDTPVLFCSSGAVYGRQAVDLVPEDANSAPDPLHPAAAYAEGKRAAEFLCASGSNAARIARCFAFAGPHVRLDAHFAAGNFLRDALAGGPIVIGGDGTPVRSYLYPADLVIWLWTILAKGVPGRAYNVGSESAVSIAELAGVAREVVNPACAVEVRGRAIAAQMPERYVPSTARARAELGLEEWIGLRDAYARWRDWLLGG